MREGRRKERGYAREKGYDSSGEMKNTLLMVSLNKFKFRQSRNLKLNPRTDSGQNSFLCIYSIAENMNASES